MKTKIQVTQEHIKRGKRKDCELCPIAYAIHEVVKPEVSLISVMNTNVILQHETLRLPDIARTFVRNFDAFGSGKPISFELDIPSELLAEAK